MSTDSQHLIHAVAIYKLSQIWEPDCPVALHFVDSWEDGVTVVSEVTEDFLSIGMGVTLITADPSSKATTSQLIRAKLIENNLGPAV